MQALFIGSAESKPFPDRFGYYVGLRTIEQAGAEHSLRELAQMPPQRARAVLLASLDRLVQKAGGCK
jgi:hypothetical protein